MFDERVTLLENKPLNRHYYKLAFRSRKIAAASWPGQFVNVRVSDSCDPFLRRPFSVYKTTGLDRVEILYEVVGKGTDLLSHLKPGAELDILGPLGKKFSTPPKDTLIIFVGGGVGIAPVLFLDSVYQADYLVLGFRSKSYMVPRSEFKNKKSKKIMTTNDGSLGRKGFVTDSLGEILEKEKKRSVYIYACGPTPMMNAVMKLAGAYGAKGELSVEEKMACGIGACLGCIVKTKAGQKTACKDGPVFSFDDFKGAINE